jgi:hypothetical protein
MESFMASLNAEMNATTGSGLQRNPELHRLQNRQSRVKPEQRAASRG